MGRSVAEFQLPGRTQEEILGIAAAFAREQRLSVDGYGPNHVHLSAGSIWWTGKRALAVMAWNVPGGVTVRVEAWAEGLVTLNANPTELLGFVPRRATWRLASSLVSRLGVAPEAVFIHY